MTSAFAMLAPNADPLPHEPYRIKWTMTDAGQWVRDLMLRLGNDEFLIRRLPDPDLSTPTDPSKEPR